MGGGRPRAADPAHLPFSAHSGSQLARRHSPQREPIRPLALGPLAAQAPSGGSCSPQVSLQGGSQGGEPPPSADHSHGLPLLEWALNLWNFSRPASVSQPSLALGSSQGRQRWVHFTGGKLKAPSRWSVRRRPALLTPSWAADVRPRTQFSEAGFMKDMPSQVGHGWVIRIRGSSPQLGPLTEGPGKCLSLKGLWAAGSWGVGPSPRPSLPVRHLLL